MGSQSIGYCLPAEVVGGEDDSDFYRRNDVPYCTVYGDGQVVWANATASGYEVLFRSY